MCLPELDHKWPRFTIPTGTLPFLDGDFLFDPMSEQGRSVNAAAAEFNSLADRPCIVLLGDSGFGKSDVFRKAYNAIRLANDANHRAIFCDVADFADDVLIDRFLSSTPFADWTNSEATLSLFIDGLDEGLMRGNGWGGILERTLSKWSEQEQKIEAVKPAPIERLRLRISCRPGLWPVSLRNALGSYFGSGRPADGQSSISTLDLLPLRRRDVELAAADHGIDAVRFIDEVERAGATSFAVRPLSLKLLIGTMREDGKLPNTHVEMFRRGCLHLVQEHNAALRESSIRPRVTSVRRLQIASRIAALTIFCGKPWIERTASNEANSDSSILSADEIRGPSGLEDISAEELIETLNSGLFSYQDAKSFRWAHQSFAAFLAAEWCGKSALSTRDLRELILVNGAGGSGVPQQVVWTATWLCEIRPAFQSLVSKSSPALLFTLDDAAIPISLRPSLVRKVLETRLTHEQTRALMQLGMRLNHPAIAKQLKPIIASKTRDLDQRNRAIDLAIACEPIELSADLSRVALDTTENPSMRHSAAFAVSRFGTKEARKALLPLASVHDDDEDQNLKGWSLAANWPENISSVEVLGLLDQQRRPNYYGGYFTFLYNLSVGIADNLSDGDVPAAVLWCATHRTIGDISILNDLVAAIILRAFISIGDPHICNLLAEELFSRIRANVQVIPVGTGRRRLREWSGLLKSRPHERSLLLRRGLEIIPPTDRYRLSEFIRALDFEDGDLRFLAELARHNPAVYSQPVSALFWNMGTVAGIFDAIYQGVAGGYLDQGLRRALEEKLDGPTAQFERARLARESEAANEAENRRTQLQNWFSDALNASEAGNPASWVDLWRIIWEMDSGRWEGSPRIDGSKGWKALDELKRHRVLEAAARYLRGFGDLHFDFIGKRTHPIWASALYSALLLAWRERPELLQDTTERESWVWTTIALWFPYSQKHDDWTQLMVFLSQNNSRAFLESTEFVVTEEIKNGEALAVHWRKEVPWPAGMANILLRAVDSPETPLLAWSSCLEWGLASFPDEFEDVIVGKIFELASNFPFPPHKEKLIAACCVFFRHGKGDPWERLAEVFYARPSLNQDFFEQVGGLPPENAFLERMSDCSLGEFYVWISREYPEGSENITSGFGALGPDFATRTLRDAAFFAMRDRGNLSVFNFVAQSFPEKKWIGGHRPAAIEAALRRKWEARTPKALLQLAAERSIPWHQTKSAFIGAAVMPTALSVPLGMALSDLVPLWLRICLSALVAAILSVGLLVWIWLLRKRK